MAVELRRGQVQLCSWLPCGEEMEAQGSWEECTGLRWGQVEGAFCFVLFCFGRGVLKTKWTGWGGGREHPFWKRVSEEG